MKAETDTVLSKTGRTHSCMENKSLDAGRNRLIACKTLAHCGHTDSLLSETDSQLQKMRLSVVGHRDKLTVVRRKRDRLTHYSQKRRKTHCYQRGIDPMLSETETDSFIPQTETD